MEKNPTLIAAVAVMVLGLVMMIFINRLLPVPLDLIITGLGFILLFVAPFIYFFGRDRNRY